MPNLFEHFKRVRIGYALFVLACALGLYLRTLAPTITWQHDGYDGGDLITAAYTLGIPHPTGYPTFVLLGKLFTLLPWGDIAHRVNLLSAMCAALAVTLCYLAGVRLLRPGHWARPAAICAALLLATSRIFWSQAIITEVYALNTLFFAAFTTLCLYTLESVSVGPDNPIDRTRLLRLVSAMALVYGLSLGNHLTMVLSAPLLLGLVGAIWQRRVLFLADWARIAAWLLLGLCVYAYLPLRANAQPLLNWGNSRTLPGLWWVLSGGPYRQFVFRLPPAAWVARVLTWISLLRQQFSVPGTVLGLFGAWKQAQRWPRFFQLLLLTMITYSLYAIGYNTTDSYVYLLPVYWIFALWVASGAQSLLGICDHAARAWRKSVTVLLCILLSCLPLSSLHANLPSIDLSQDRSAYNWGRQAFAQVPDLSIIVTTTDAHTFTLWYFSRVVMSHRLIAIIDPGLLGYAWYTVGLRQSYPWLHWPSTVQRAPTTLEDLLEANRGSVAIFWTDPDAAQITRYQLKLDGVLYY